MVWRYIRNSLAAIIVFVAAVLLVVVMWPNTVKKLVAGTPIDQVFPPLLPDLKLQKQAYWLDQNWSNEDRFWFHHASQGTATFPVPYDWFIALEQPGLALSQGLVKDIDYLARFGFIASPRSLDANKDNLARYGFSDQKGVTRPNGVLTRTPAENDDGLPVGFARTVGGIDPATNKQQPDQLGLTCAACHTGHIEYKGVSLRYDGGPAMIDLDKLSQAVGLSIFYTVKLPWRFNSFADRVLGEQAADPQARAELKKRLSDIWSDVYDQSKIQQTAIEAEARKHGASTQTIEGFGRLDALNRIGNQVFYSDLTDGQGKTFQANIAAQLAPVSFPPIWTVPWLSWAQYDASIGQPLIRNAGEALGVSAIINLTSPANKFHPLFNSSVAVNNLYTIEALLKGDSPFASEPRAFHGLLAPKWPAALFPNDKDWQLQPQRVENGRALYRQYCVECHLGPVNDPVFDHAYPDASFWTSSRWSVTSSGNKILNPRQLAVDAIATDPEQSKVLELRHVDVPANLELDPIKELKVKWGCDDVDTPASTNLPYAEALMIVVDRTNQQWFNDNGISPSDQKQVLGDGKNCPNKNKGYKARPLDGVWATAPYLHNGSVPSLWWLLKPARERPKSFCIGAADFNPKIVGYDVPDGGVGSCPDGETLFHALSPAGTGILGNSMLGHSFEDAGDKTKAGVLGKGFSDDERYDLIEYLKTL